MRPASLLIFLLVIMSISACSNLDRSFNLRYWERNRLLAEREKLQHHYSESLSAAKSAISYAESFGDSDFRLAVSLDDLAEIYMDKEKYKLAKPLIRRSLDVLSRAKQASANNLEKEIIAQEKALALRMLGDLDYQTGKYSDALKSFADSRAILSLYCKQDGKDAGNPLGLEFVKSIWGEAESQYKLNDLTAAESSYRIALKIAQENYYPIAEEIKDRFQEFFQSTGRSLDAQKLNIGNHWSLTILKAKEAYRAKNFALATQLYLQCLDDSRSMNDDGFHYAVTCKLLADNCGRQADFKGVAYYDNEAIASCRKMAHPSTTLLIDLYADLARLQNLLGKTVEWENTLKEQLKLEESVHGAQSLEAAKVMASLAEAELSNRKNDDAKKHAELAFHSIKPLNVYPKSSVYAFQSIARVLMTSGDYKLARQAALESIKENQGIPPTVLFQLAAILAKNGDYKQSDELAASGITHVKAFSSKNELETVNEMTATLNQFIAGKDAISVRCFRTWISELSK